MFGRRVDLACSTDWLVINDREAIGVQDEFVYIAPYTKRPVFYVEFPAGYRGLLGFFYSFFKRVLCPSLGQEFVF